MPKQNNIREIRNPDTVSVEISMPSIDICEDDDFERGSGSEMRED